MCVCVGGGVEWYSRSDNVLSNAIVCVCACVRACVRACVPARARVRVNYSLILHNVQTRDKFPCMILAWTVIVKFAFRFVS